MTLTDITNAAQIDFWNAGGGHTWATLQALLDRQLDPLGRAAIEALAPSPGQRILDVGCGCGHTSLQLAERVGLTGLVVGADISREMLAVACGRPVPAGACTPAFVEADAQIDAFADAPFDAIFSRFGVMFFADTVAAFANLRASLQPGGALSYVAWGPPEENLFMRLPIDRAAPFLPPRPPFDPDAPGPYRLADPDKNRTFLAQAGFTDIRIERHDAMIGGLDVEDALVVALKVGPLGAALRENPDKAPAVLDAVTELLNAYRDAEGHVFMPAVTWIVTAGNPT